MRQDFLDRDLRQAVLWEVAEAASRWDIWQLDEHFETQAGHTSPTDRAQRFSAFLALFRTSTRTTSNSTAASPLPAT